MMIVHIRDWYGIVDKFEVIETRKAPEGFEGKISVIFINSRGDKEKAVVNSDHIQVKLKPEVKKRIDDLRKNKC